MRIGIIGAGITGLSVAKKLQNKGFEVQVFEKARGVGGRMSTRRSGEEFAFDHGAQCFTARTKPFQSFVRKYEKLGVIKEWQGKVVSIEDGKKLTKRLWFETHWVACPNMNSLCKELAKNLDVSIKTEASKIIRIGNYWQIFDVNENNLGKFDWVICTAPPAQTHNLMPDCFEHKEIISSLEMSACFALMLGFKEKVKINWVAAKIRKSILKWATINSTRPDRNPDVTSIQIHSRDNWADKNKDKEMADIQKEMIEEFKHLTGIDGNKADYVSSHRWLYSLVKTTENVESYIDVKNKLAACGDWCLTSRIEEAWLSGKSVVDKICEGL